MSGDGGRLLSAVCAIPADFRASDCDLDLAVSFDLPLQLLEKTALHFPDLPAAKARHMNVVAGSMAFVVVLVAVNVEQVELVD